MAVSILVVDDDPVIRNLLTAYFFKVDYSFHAVSCLIEAREMLASKFFNIVIVDINLSAENGLDLVSELRVKRDKFGIIILSAYSETTDKIIGMEVGADDYISKPFDPRELLVRIKRLAERINYQITYTQQENSIQTLSFENIRIEFVRRIAYSNDQKIELTSKQFDLLALLAKNHGKTLSRDQICMVLNGHHCFVDDRSIDMLIKRLRKQLSPLALDNVIQSVRGAGYVFTLNPID